MEHYNYQDTFKALFEKAVSHYKNGNHDKDTYYSEAELAAIAANGWRTQDFFDYAEDLLQLGVPSYEIAQSIEQVRREYFLHVLNGETASTLISTSDLPEKTDSIDGIRWLPRILPKARGKLTGQLPDEIMYCCGGDRNFLSAHDIHPAEFLRVVWANWEDDQGIVNFVKTRSPSTGIAVSV